MTLGELRAKKSGDQSLWWTSRFLKAVISAGKQASEVEKNEAIDAFLLIASQDSEWANLALGDRSPDGHQLSELLAGDRLESALSRLQLPTSEADAMLRARMYSSAAAWGFKIKAEARSALWKKAWAQLQRVPADARGAEWKAVAIGPAAEADYPSFRDLAMERLAELKEDFWRAHFLPNALDKAAKHTDWPTFDSWLKEWKALPEPLLRGHSACAVINLEGLRALDEGRLPDVEGAMRSLLENAPADQFVSNDDTSALPKRLRAEGKLLDLCDAFDAIVKRVDWRLLT